MARICCPPGKLRGRIASQTRASAAAFAARGDYRRAELAYKLMLRFDPDDVLSFLSLVNLYVEALGYQVALDFADNWLGGRPSDAWGRIEMFELCLSRRDLGKAREYLQVVSQHDPDSPMVAYMTGLLLHHEDRLDESMAHFRSALAKRPDLHDASFAMAHTLVAQGRREEAITLLEETARAAPDQPMVYAVLARLNYFKDPSHRYLSHMASLLQGGHMREEERAVLHFTLGSIFDSCGRYDDAFGHFRRGNELASRFFNRESFIKYIDDQIDIFDGAFLRDAYRADGDDARGPVFIVGMPRSGSTLVEQILASHPSVVAGGERSVLSNLIDRLPAEIGAGVGYPECVRRLDRAAIESISRRCLDEFGSARGEGRLFVDKTLTNYLKLGLICLLFPNARIIHCKRNPLDTCLSCYFQNFREISYATDLGALGLVYRQYERMMAHWRSALPIEIFEVEYEELVSDPEPTIRTMLDYCGLPWSPACLDFHRTRRAVLTASVYQVKRPLYSHAVERWRHYEKHIPELIEAMRSCGGD